MGRGEICNAWVHVVQAGIRMTRGDIGGREGGRGRSTHHGCMWGKGEDKEGQVLTTLGVVDGAGEGEEGGC